MRSVNTAALVDLALAASAESRRALLARWRALALDPASPDRYELTERGELVAGPRATNRHQLIVSLVAEQLRSRLGGLVVTEVAIVTSIGIRVPDVAWMPASRRDELLSDDPLDRAPELVVEVLSAGNRAVAIRAKTRGYLDAGAREMAVVDRRGATVFHRADGEHAESALGVELELAGELFG